MHRKLITANSSHYIQLIRARSQRSHTSSTLNEFDARETSRRAGAPEGTSLGIRPAQPHSKRKHNHFHIFQNWHRWKRRPCAPPFAINLIAKSIIWSVLEKRTEKNLCGDWASQNDLSWFESNGIAFEGDPLVTGSEQASKHLASALINVVQKKG